MNRRDALVSLLALWAAPALAQQTGKAWRIGFLSLDDANLPIGQAAREKFPASLKRLGYEEGRNLVIEWRWGNAKPETLPALAEELVRLKVDLVVARGNASIEAARRATRTIPIVMIGGNNPVELGMVESLARPGGNVTGTTFTSPEILEKMLQLLKEVSPKAIRVAIPWNANNPRTTGIGKIQADAYERAAAHFGLKIQYFDATRREEVKALTDKIAASPIDALVISGDPLFRGHLKDFAAVAVKRRIVSVGNIPGIAEAGGLLHLTPDAQSAFDRTASYVGRILKGAKPSALPVEEPTMFRLVINLNTAKAIGVTIPQAVLLRADQVIE